MKEQASYIRKCKSNYYSELLDDLVRIINTKGLMIGSRRFGGADGNSDWDYIISDIWKDKIFHILNETGIDWWMIIPEENSNIYSLYDIKFEYEGLRYNVLIYEDIKFHKLINNIHLFNTYGSKFDEFLKSNKKARVYIFNGFLQYLFGPELVPFECTEMNRTPCIKLDLNNSNTGLKMEITKFEESELLKLNREWDKDFDGSSMERYFDEIFSSMNLVRVGISRYNTVILFNRDLLNDRILRLINIPMLNALLYDRNNNMSEDFLEYFYDAIYPLYEDYVSYNDLYLNSYDYVFEFLGSKDLIYKSYYQAKDLVSNGYNITHLTGKKFEEIEDNNIWETIYQSGWSKDEIIK